MYFWTPGKNIFFFIPLAPLGNIQPQRHSSSGLGSRRSFSANSGNGPESSPQLSYQPTAAMLEDENNQLEDALSSKVKVLKSLTIDMGNEVRHQNKMLSGMDEDFDKSGGLLEATMGRLKRLTQAGHYKLWLYLLLFTFFVFFVCWLIVRF